MRTLWCDLNAIVELQKLRPGKSVDLGEIDGTRLVITDTSIGDYDHLQPATWCRIATLHIYSEEREDIYPFWRNDGIGHAVVYNDSGEVLEKISKLSLDASIKRWRKNEAWRNESNRRQQDWHLVVAKARQRPWSFSGWRFRLHTWKTYLRAAFQNLERAAKSHRPSSGQRA